MAIRHEELSTAFYEWEIRGRGWTMFNEPVLPEPPFVRFEHRLRTEEPDDGRKPTLLSTLYQALVPPRKSPETMPTAPHEPEPDPFYRRSLVEIDVFLSSGTKRWDHALEHFLSSLSLIREPIGFELLASGNRVRFQFICEIESASHIEGQLKAHFSDCTFTRRENVLETAWSAISGDEVLVVEFGLKEEFVFPLAEPKLDPFIGLVPALAKAKDGEVAVFQVLFHAAAAPWAESVMRAVSHADGKPLFANAPELTKAAKSKVSRPLYACVVRLAIKTQNSDRTLEIARAVAGSLRVYSNPVGNQLVPLENDEYPLDLHIEDVLLRQSRRSGMLLTVDELAGFVHFPSSDVSAEALAQEQGRTKAAPANATQGILLGENFHGGMTREVRLSADQRVCHCHLIGASGTGKSTLLYNLIRQDIENGEGLAVLDPHGDLIDRILGVIPAHRVKDVILVDPADEEFSVGFNILSAHSDFEKNLLASDLVSVFHRLSTSWGDQLGSVLQNAILAFLESDSGGTLSDLRCFLIDKAYRESFLESVRDPDIAYYWRHAFPQLGGNKSIGSVVTRLDTFLAPKPIRYMVSQKSNRLDFGDITDSGKIFLARLPRGEMGNENSSLLGSFLIAKFQQAAMARQRQSSASRRNFWIYVDEFFNFITPSMAEILTGARKYRVGLTLAHQDLRQLERDREVGSAVLSNAYARVIFRVGDADARSLESGLSFFEAKDLQNLERGEAICRLEKSAGDFNLRVSLRPEPSSQEQAERRREVIQASRSRYATPRSEIEAARNESRPVPKERVKTGMPAQAAATVTPSPIQTMSFDAKVPADEAAAHTSKPAPSAKAEQFKTKIIQRVGQLGYSYHEEFPLQDGKRIDLVLIRDDGRIACEIGVTTTPEHEVENIQKCFGQDFCRVVHICDNTTMRRRIQELLQTAVSPADRDKVECLTLAAFLTSLDAPLSQNLRPSENTPQKAIPSPEPQRSPEEQRALERDMLAELRRMLKRGD